MSKRNRRNKNVGGGAEEKVPAEVFENETDANEALSKVAKVTNIANKQKENAEKKAKAAKAPKVTKDGRPKLPPLPRSASAPKPLVDCACGCGMKTRSKFAPGHDSRLNGWAMRIARGMLKLDDLTDKYGTTVGEKNAVEAHIKQLKKDGKWEALKTPKAPTGAAAKAKAAAAE